MTGDTNQKCRGKCGAKNFILGVTGGVGSGKSSVLAALKEKYGFKILETDLLAKELMEPGTDCFLQLVSAFGDGILASDGKIDKKMYADLIYRDESLRRRSDEIVHPAVWQEAQARISAYAAQAGNERPVRIALETALPSPRYREMCNAVLYVFTPRPVRIARLMESRGYSYERCLEIMEQQMSEDAYAAYADAVLDNGSGMQESGEQLREILKKLNVSG